VPDWVPNFAYYRIKVDGYDLNGVWGPFVLHLHFLYFTVSLRSNSTVDLVK
jgi:hypothetical protein